MLYRICDKKGCTNAFADKAGGYSCKVPVGWVKVCVTVPDEEQAARQARQAKRLAESDVEVVEGELSIDGVNHKIRFFKPDSVKRLEETLEDEPPAYDYTEDREYCFCPTCAPLLPETGTP